MSVDPGHGAGFGEENVKLDNVPHDIEPMNKMAMNTSFFIIFLLLIFLELFFGKLREEFLYVDHSRGKKGLCVLA
jgi:hypothetical protein